MLLVSNHTISARNLGIFIRIFILILVLFLIYINSRKTKKTKKKLNQITLSSFELFFDKLLNNKLDSNFIGLGSNSVNCIYFNIEKNKINMEYEVVDKEQINYAKKLIKYAKLKGYEIVKTSYENKTNHDKSLNAPVYQIICNLDLQSMVKVSKEIFTAIFNCDAKTKFNLVL